MSKRVERAFEGLVALPNFPVVLLTCAENVMTAVSFHYYSTRPACVQIGVRKDNWTHQLILEHKEFGINLPTADMMETVKHIGEVSGRVEDKWAATGLTRQPATQISSRYMVALAEFCTVVETQRPRPQNDQIKTEHRITQCAMKLQAIS